MTGAEVDRLDRMRESMRERGLIRPSTPPLTDEDKRSIRECVAKARPMTDRQRAELLRILRGSRCGQAMQ